MRLERGVLGLAIAAAMAGCTERPSGGDAIVARTTVVASALPARALHASVEERFGLEPRVAPADDEVTTAAGLLRWDLPAGWVERAPTSMRIASFLAGGDAEAECYLTVLAGEAGGIGGNVNRWLAQMGRPALGPAQIDALPRARLFDRDAVLLETEGTFTGMSGGAGVAGRRLIGLLVVEPGGSAFLKLVGPDALVARERAAFLALAASFRAAQPEVAQQSGATRVERAAGLVVQVPASWTRVAEKPPRALDLRVGDVECSVTVLAGEAGGARANIDRWRGQIGLAPLDDAQYGALEVVEVLGGPAQLAESTADGKSVLGVVAAHAGRTVFVKMTGPVEAIARERAAFLALCRSLEAG